MAPSSSQTATARKTSLEQYSKNIICVDTSVKDLVGGIAYAVELANDWPARNESYVNSGLLRDWTLSFDRVSQPSECGISTMFLSSVPQVVYVDPWTLVSRIGLAALRKGSIRIVYFYERPDTSTFRYRVYNMIQALATSNADVSAAYFSQCEIDRLDQVIGMADVLVVCRSRYTGQLNRLITRAKEFGCRVLFDVDDLIFDIDYVHLILNTLDQQFSEVEWDFWFACVGRLGATLRLCDGVIVTNEYLASESDTTLTERLYVIPNFLNDEQIRSLAVFNLKKNWVSHVTKIASRLLQRDADPQQGFRNIAGALHA